MQSSKPKRRAMQTQTLPTTSSADGAARPENSKQRRSRIRMEEYNRRKHDAMDTAESAVPVRGEAASQMDNASDPSPTAAMQQELAEAQQQLQQLKQQLQQAEERSAKMLKVAAHWKSQHAAATQRSAPPEKAGETLASEGGGDPRTRGRARTPPPTTARTHETATTE